MAKRMTTPEDLREYGWIIRDAIHEGAVDCTSILAPIPFIYWRREVEPTCDTWSKSHPIGDMHGLILAGDYTAPHKILPYDFMYANHCENLINQDSTIGRAKYAVELAEREYARHVNDRQILVEVNKL